MTATDTRPMSKMNRQNAVREAMLAVRRDWPTATVTFGPEQLNCVLIVRDPLSTYVISITEPQPGDAGAVVESLWVSHRPGAYSALPEFSAPDWAEGWVD